MEAEYNVPKCKSDFYNAILPILMNSNLQAATQDFICIITVVLDFYYQIAFNKHQVTSRSIDNLKTIYDTKVAILPGNSKNEFGIDKKLIVFFSLLI